MRFVAFVIAMLVAVTAGAVDGQVIAARDGRHVVVADRELFAARLVALAESCSVNSTAYAASKEQWSAVADLPSYIRVVFSQARNVSLARSGGLPPAAQPIVEIRLPLPAGQWPAHVLLAGRDRLVAVTKYDPLVLRELVSLPELGLGTEAPYSSLLPFTAPR